MEDITVKVEFKQKSEGGKPVRYLEKSFWIRGYKCKCLEWEPGWRIFGKQVLIMAETVSKRKINGKWSHRGNGQDHVALMGQCKALYWGMAERLEGHENGSVTI